MGYKEIKWHQEHQRDQLVETIEHQDEYKDVYYRFKHGTKNFATITGCKNA
jgi:hypothetical protein